MHFLWGDPRLPKRFWTKVRAVPFTGCWLWAASTDTQGYGKFSWNSRLCQAHRLTRAILVGDLATWSTDRALDVVDHLCTVKPCVRPDHVEPVAQIENLRRAPAWSGQRLLTREVRNARALARYHQHKARLNPERNARRRLARNEEDYHGHQ